MSLSTPARTVFLFGPTAVGKTDLLLKLFEGRGEVVSVDSLQIYRSLDIGTAKPRPGYLRRLPHHLIDIRNPEDPFSAGEFIRCAEEASADIMSRGLQVVMSGGTGFYFYSYLYGLGSIPDIPFELRSKLEQRGREEGYEDLYRELTVRDPEAAAGIDPHNFPRIVRALEVCLHTGKTFSSYKQTVQPRTDTSVLLLGLQRSREELYRRINERVHTLFDQGLEDEVKRLRSRGYTAETPAMKGIGYREFFLPMTRDERIALIQKNSRHYAKRQITFFKRLGGVEWFSPEDLAGLEKRINEFYRFGA